MDTLHTMLRSIRRETKSRPNHLTVFREFLGHLDKLGRRGTKAARPAKKPARRGGNK